MKFEKVVSKFLTNKYVLYVVAFLAITNVMGYMLMGQFKAVLVFILVGCIMTYFSKNMNIVLLTPLIFTALLVSISKREGFEDAPKSSTPSPIPDFDLKQNIEPTTVKGVQDPSPDNGAEEKLQPTPTEPKKTEKFEVGKKGQNRLDYGSTLEAAYEDLNNALGSDGIRRLTEDTQRLMKQQLELADAMKGMTPMLKQAQDMLKSLNITELGDVTSLIKQMGGTQLMKPQA
jgi:hypothetical protein